MKALRKIPAIINLTQTEYFNFLRVLFFILTKNTSTGLLFIFHGYLEPVNEIV